MRSRVPMPGQCECGVGLLSGAACEQEPLLFLVAGSDEESPTPKRCSPAWNSGDCPVHMAEGLLLKRVSW